MSKQHARIVLWLSLMMACITGCTPQSCSQQSAPIIPPRSATSRATMELDPDSAKYGGSPRAWITPAGDTPDSGYCAAKLKLPLSSEPAWVHEYGYGFSATPPSEVVHHDGILTVTANCSQLLAIDTETGTEIYNKDLYQHKDIKSDEILNRVFLHPDGTRMVGQDNLGRHYCWDTSGDSPRELWVSRETNVLSGFVVIGDSVFTSWADSILCLDLANGRRRWSYPSLESGGGIILGVDGVLTFWTRSDIYIAIDATDGSLLWSFMGSQEYEGVRDYARAIIDDKHHRVYMMLTDEWIQCREITSGAIIWEHGWSDVLRPERYQAITEITGAPSYPMPANQAVITPRGLVLPISSGCVLALDHDGNRRWVYYGDVPLSNAVGFDNGILITESYLGSDYRGLLEWQKIFCETPPDWSNYAEADPEIRDRLSFDRMIVLDTATGEMLSSFELQSPMSTITPAYGNVVISEVGETERNTHRIVAYDWIDWEGN